ncbi:MAG: hypothetical protein WA160_14120 [Pseudobdellovibrio sp.]
MNKKVIALVISSTLLLNSFQMALASTAAGDLKASTETSSSLSDEQINQLLQLAHNKTTAEMEQTLVAVQSLIQKLQSMDSSNESDKILRYANKIQIVLVAISAYTMHSHLKNDAEVKKITLAISTASLILNKVITMYKEKNRLDSKQISKTIFETSKELTKSGVLTPELEKITSSLDGISAKLLENQGSFDSLVQNLGGSQDMALMASVGYLVLHIVYPKIATETDGLLKNILPKIQQGTQKIAEVSKKPIAYGTAGAMGIPDILSMTVGLSSEQSKKIIDSTLIQLNITQNKLATEINERKGQ